MKSKRGMSAWIWILIIIILIVVGIGIYFWLTGGDVTPAVNGGNPSLIQPPAFPE